MTCIKPFSVPNDPALRNSANVHIPLYPKEAGKRGKTHYFRADGRAYAFTTEGEHGLLQNDSPARGFKLYRGRDAQGRPYDVYKFGTKRAYETGKAHLAAYLRLPVAVQGMLAPTAAFTYKSRRDDKTVVFVPFCNMTMDRFINATKTKVEELHYTLVALGRQMQAAHDAGYANCIPYSSAVGLHQGRLGLRDLSATVGTSARRAGPGGFEARGNHCCWSAPETFERAISGSAAMKLDSWALGMICLRVYSVPFLWLEDPRLIEPPAAEPSPARMRQALRAFEAARSNAAAVGEIPAVENDFRHAWRQFNDSLTGRNDVYARIVRGLTHFDPAQRMGIADALGLLGAGDAILPLVHHVTPDMTTLSFRLNTDFDSIQAAWPYIPPPQQVAPAAPPPQPEPAAPAPLQAKYTVRTKLLTAAVTFCIATACIQAAVALLPVSFALAPILFWPVALSTAAVMASGVYWTMSRMHHGQYA